jgi:hypothetical protein
MSTGRQRILGACAAATLALATLWCVGGMGKSSHHPDEKLPNYIDRQRPAASCEIRLMPTPMSRNGGDFPDALRSVDRRERPRSTSGTVVAFSLACLIKKQYLMIGSISDA